MKCVFYDSFLNGLNLYLNANYKLWNVQSVVHPALDFAWYTLGVINNVVTQIFYPIRKATLTGLWWLSLPAQIFKPLL